jgi:hypothetical protein
MARWILKSGALGGPWENRFPMWFRVSSCTPAYGANNLSNSISSPNSIVFSQEEIAQTFLTQELCKGKNNDGTALPISEVQPHIFMLWPVVDL